MTLLVDPLPAVFNDPVHFQISPLLINMKQTECFNPGLDRQIKRPAIIGMPPGFGFLIFLGGVLGIVYQQGLGVAQNICEAVF